MSVAMTAAEDSTGVTDATMITTRYTIVPSPIGDLMLTGDGHALTGLHMGRGVADVRPEWRHEDAVLVEARRQVDAYFAGELTEFDLPLSAAGTAFQSRVWSALRTIPYAGSVSYAEIARRIGNPAAVRAVGAANGRNPIGIIVPCHRVIGADGSLTGYGGGLDRKQWLLAHEARVAARMAQG